MRKYLSKYKWQIILAFTVFIVIIPAVINWFFKLESPCNFFVAEWGAGDVLAFYGAMLASVTTIFGVYISIEYAQRNYQMDEANRVKPYLSLTHYKSESKTNWGLGIPAEATDADGVEQPQSYYTEYKLDKVYIVIDQAEIRFQDKLSDNQQQRIKSGGFEWYDHGGGCRSLQSHPFVSMPFDVENVGSGAAINTMIAFYKKGEERRGASLYTIKQGDSFYFHVFCDEADSVVDNEYVIELLYGDIIGNYYSQKYPVHFKRDAGTGRFCTRVNLIGKQEIDEKNMKESQNGENETGNA